MRLILLLILTTVFSAWGQGVISRYPIAFPQIRAYLTLTDEQMAKIIKQNGDFNQWAEARQQRMYAVQVEIAEETAKSPLDPQALGVRYAEVESIRREIAERSAAVTPANVALLTDAQKMKLKALEEALKLVPTGNDAKSLRLLPDDCTAVYRTGVFSGDFSSQLPVSVLSPIVPVAGCVAQYIAAPQPLNP